MLNRTLIKERRDGIVMIPDYIVIILGWVLLISTTITFIADIIVMCVVNKKLKAFNKVYKELLKDKGEMTHE